MTYTMLVSCNNNHTNNIGDNTTRRQKWNVAKNETFTENHRKSAFWPIINHKITLSAISALSEWVFQKIGNNIAVLLIYDVTL